MYPWGHLAFGYLIYSAISHTRFRRAPDALTTTLLALGTQLPDLIDKPLSWTFGVLSSGRSLAHSVLAFAVVTGVALAFARRRDRLAPAIALGVGYGSHLVADSILPAWEGHFGDLAFLAYPFVSVSPDSSGLTVLDVLTNLGFTPYFWLQLVLVVLAFAVWVRDGAPVPLVGRVRGGTGSESPAER